MPQLNPNTEAAILGAFGVIVAALLAALIGLFSQIKIKQAELRAQARRELSAQRLSFYLPLLRLCYELDARVGRILANVSTDWLRKSYLDSIKNNEGFAKDPKHTGYFIMSSIYVFACFFGWTEATKRGIDATRSLAEMGRMRRKLLTLARKSRQLFGGSHHGIFFFDHDIDVVRRLFQYEELFFAYTATRQHLGAGARDACKLHRHFQHSIGEMMLHRDGATQRCKTFREFFEAYRGSDDFRYWFVPLEALFVDLCDFEPGADIEVQVEAKRDIRPLRLLAIRYWCRILMRNLAREIGIVTPAAEEVLHGRSKALRETIMNIRIEALESYLAALPRP